MEKILPWFHLKSVPGVGNHLFKKLIDHFKSPDNVLQASDRELLAVEGVSHRLMASIKSHRLPGKVKAEIDQVIKNRFKIITMADSAFPPLLREIPDPPPFLYVNGELDGSIRNIAVVGSRHATSYGLSTTKRLCTDLSAFDITVVSGMARGIDTAAHEGALQGKGKTIAVLGSGLQRIYPAQNKKLFNRIAENGAVVSEFPLNTGPEPHNFPVRNRIISGISLGTVVVEATRKSGSLITARLAAEQNREVFAVPGSIQSFKSTGTHTLIKQGAKLVEHAQDVIEELSPGIIDAKMKSAEPGDAKTDKIPPLSPEESAVYGELGPYPIHIDELVRKIGMEPGKLSSILLQLELMGIIQQSPGKLFSTAHKPKHDFY